MGDNFTSLSKCSRPFFFESVKSTLSYLKTPSGAPRQPPLELWWWVRSWSTCMGFNCPGVVAKGFSLALPPARDEPASQPSAADPQACFGHLLRCGCKLFLGAFVVCWCCVLQRKTRGGEKTQGEGKTYHQGRGINTIKATPQERFWTLPLMIRSPPLFVHALVIFLRGNGHRPDKSHFQRPPKLVLEGALYSTFPPPPESHDTFCPPPLVNSQVCGMCLAQELGRTTLQTVPRMSTRIIFWLPLPDLIFFELHVCKITRTRPPGKERGCRERCQEGPEKGA